MVTGISKREFARRRKKLMAEMEPDGIAIVPSARIAVRNRDTEYRFRQDSDFFYLTGFDEPDAVAVFMPHRKHGEFVLFCQDRDPAMELWHGYRYGPEGACKHFAASDAFPIGDIDEILPGLIEGRERIYYAMGRNPDFDHQLMQWVNTIRDKSGTGAQPPGEFLDLNYILHEMRLLKSAAEIRVMQQAADITVRAHTRAIKACKPGLSEYHLEAELSDEFIRSGCRHDAYESIVGSGKNGCILHYTTNRDSLDDGDLVLIDAGCEYDYYASDISRTFPVNGRFSKPQRALYDLVLKSQRAAINAIKVGRHWNESHEACVAVLTAGLVELGLLKGRLETLLKKEAYKPFYMHRTGHWLGMDVHDVGDYRVAGEWRQLEAGMVMTVEPGLYISPDETSVAKKWRGIGIRIEDDVLVTSKGPRVLTEAMPKTAADIEKLMRSAGKPSRVSSGRKKASSGRKKASNSPQKAKNSKAKTQKPKTKKPKTKKANIGRAKTTKAAK